jgi:hydrogenase-4 component E
VTTSVEGFLVILMLTNLWLLGSSRLLSCIAAVSVQGVLLGLLPLVIGIDAPLWRLILQAAISIGFKGIALPLLLLRAARSVDVRREVEPFVGYSASLLIGVVVSMLAPRTGFWLPDVGIGLGGMACVGIATGVLESVTARLRLARVPQLLVAAIAMAALAMALALVR